MSNNIELRLQYFISILWISHKRNKGQGFKKRWPFLQLVLGTVCKKEMLKREREHKENSPVNLIKMQEGTTEH